ncbi:MAG TPA: hypothetical protein VG324_06195 [Blastocatellia bacterium]|nr:hypothetical protein [Blastocatellia bacterium]
MAFAGASRLGAHFAPATSCAALSAPSLFPACPSPILYPACIFNHFLKSIIMFEMNSPEALDKTEIRRSLAHAFWIGGPSDAGKTTVARLLIQRRRWQWYPCDLHEHNHLIARADPVLHPNICKALGRSFDESWVHPTPQQLFEQIIASNEERFPMICDDIRLMPQRPPVLVEGPRLFPKLVSPVLTSPRQAIWLLPTEAFIYASQERRDKPSLRVESSDPERFRANFLARDRLLADYIGSEVVKLGLPYIEIDGQRTAEEIADSIQSHFAGYPAYI